MPPITKPPVVTNPTTTKPQPKSAAKPKASKPAAPPAEKKERKVLYPEALVKVLRGDKALTVAQAKALLKWENEKDYSTRLLAEQPHLKPEAAMFGSGVTDQYGETFPVLLEDEDKIKVVCWNNSHNRPFDLTHARKLAQVILNRQWRFNFENIIIGRTGIVESGQHRLVALILASQLWAGKNKTHWQQLWQSEPTIETSIAYGADEEAEVLQTLDNVKPRSLSDIFYVSPLFADLLPDGRNECSRMLDRAVGLLWRRTHQGREDITGGQFQKYMTHTASMDFVTRHPKVLECVRYIFDANRKRGIGELKGLSPGQCAAMMYLMAAGETDGDAYRNADPPQEEGLVQFTQMKQARLFWTELGKGDKTNTQFVIVKEALAEPLNPHGEVVKLSEKLVIIARAWAAYLTGQPFGRDDVQLQEGDYQVDEHSQYHLQLDELPSFGGIDFGEPTGKTTQTAEVEQEKANIKAANLAKLKEMNRERKSKKAANGSSAEADALQAKIDQLQAQLAEGEADEEPEGGDEDFGMEDDQPEE